MTRDEVLDALQWMAEDEEYDPEEGHIKADQLLLALIGDPEITEAYMALRRWHA